MGDPRSQREGLQSPPFPQQVGLTALRDGRSKTFVPTRNIAAIATITVVPETITVRPDVRMVRSSALCGDWPRRRSSRERMM
jgi:hypothetical protein